MALDLWLVGQPYSYLHFWVAFCWPMLPILSSAVYWRLVPPLYSILVTEELLMEAHEVEEKNISTLVLFSGFLAFWSIHILGGQ